LDGEPWNADHNPVAMRASAFLVRDEVDAQSGSAITIAPDAHHQQRVRFGTLVIPPLCPESFLVTESAVVEVAVQEMDDDDDDNADSDDDDVMCVICLDGEKSHLLAPCGHRCLCKGCAETIKFPFPCPMCRRVCRDAVAVDPKVGF